MILKDSTHFVHGPMLSRSCTSLVALVTVARLVGASAMVSATQDVPVGEQETFLRTAEIVDARPIGRGVTGAWRLTLRQGHLTHDAAFQSIDRRSDRLRVGDRVEENFVDSYRYNIAAYRLARLIGLTEMVPVTVEREWDGVAGALSWWVDDVAFDETTRRAERRWPDETRRWTTQMYTVRLFEELIQDTDRNTGNILYQSDWTLVMIDFSRAFRTADELRKTDDLIFCDREVFLRLRALTEDELVAAVGSLLTGDEVRGVLARRDRLVAHFEALLGRHGEAGVFF